MHYHIYGSLDVDTAFIPGLKRRIDELGMQSHVTLHGSVSNETLAAAYAGADLFLLPSLHEGDYFEGFGLVFLEANAHGVPVIGPTTGGCPEAIKQRESGYICDPGDTHAIAAHMKDILIDEKIRREACVQWAHAHDVSQAAEIIERLYEKA